MTSRQALALNYAERDRLEQRLSTDEETAVIDATRELLSDAAESIRERGEQQDQQDGDEADMRGRRLYRERIQTWHTGVLCG